ncbi:MAG: hypothetical protein SAMD01599839_01340 [Rectinema sp.]
MDEIEDDDGKKARRRLGNLGAIRREMVRVYLEAREGGKEAERIPYYRMLTFILSSAADVMKNEQLEDIEARIVALEKTATEKGKS